MLDPSLSFPSCGLKPLLLSLPPAATEENPSPTSLQLPFRVIFKSAISSSLGDEALPEGVSRSRWGHTP